MKLTEDQYLMHYGILRRSGRYPWGSGGNQAARNKSFLDIVETMKKDGLNETQIAQGFGITTTQLRAAKTIAINQQRHDKIRMAQRLKDKGMSNTAIAERMGINESSVRSLLAPGAKDKADVLLSTSDMLRSEVENKNLIQVGTGVDLHIGISDTKLRAAVAVLEEEGYEVHTIKVEQLGTGKHTNVKVLAKPGTTLGDVYRNQADIRMPGEHSEDGGRSYLGLKPIESVSSKRLAVRYAEQGGTEADGVIYVRPGVEDLSLGGSRYAQVRIAIDGTHYIKGMAVYKDDLPDGVDLMFNTNKSDTGNKLNALKPLKDDPDNPFGSTIKTGGQRRAMNVVYEEGDWDNWSKSLASQVLSKQSPDLAADQLSLYRERKRLELDEIKSLTNPAVKKRLLDAYADDVDAASVHLKAAALPRQASHVIMPIKSMKDNEVYAPNYRDGERVALVRYPHGGKFEIPELTVNNRHAPAQKLLGKQAKDAIGINSKVAERLSGADFDGDTVLVIPNNRGRLKSEPALSGLKNFDPMSYKIPAGSGTPRLKESRKQNEMGDITNLITDMTIRGASNNEIARAVRHSMVVIDAEKHGLDYRASARDNGIAQLKAKYQGSAKSGASTLISRSSATTRVPERRLARASEGGPVDKRTGQKRYVNTDRTYTNSKGEVVPRIEKSTQGAETRDARTLSSGTQIERIYADHSNALKAMANEARKTSVNTPPLKQVGSSKKVYSEQVSSLDGKLRVALRNAPLERQAQLLANAVVREKKQANPDMDNDSIKKVKSQALAEARARTGAKKTRVEITQPEWDAIQAGALSANKLEKILSNADLDKVKELATPRLPTVMTSAKQAHAKRLLAAGYTQAEVADQLGVAVSTLKSSVVE